MAAFSFYGDCQEMTVNGRAIRMIHPSQIATINEVLSPTTEQVAKAREILVVNRQGVGSVDGQMVDEAVARKARLVLERAGITNLE